jgi:hypothetical protein
MRVRITGRVAIAVAIAMFALAGSAAAAVLGLPANGSQVNDDPAAGIDPNQNAGVSDIVGGSLLAGGARVPWGTFEQQAGGAQRIFVRAFKNGQWVTRPARRPTGRRLAEAARPPNRRGPWRAGAPRTGAARSPPS